MSSTARTGPGPRRAQQPEPRPRRSGNTNRPRKRWLSAPRPAVRVSGGEGRGIRRGASDGFRGVAPLLLLLLGCAPEARFANVGDLVTEGGETIRDCRVGYRTFWRLAPDRSNAVLFLPWFQGRSADLASQIGPGKLVDDSRWFVIAVDSLANGVSSSPSNSPSQPGPAFPKITIGDMVRSQRLLVDRVLGIRRLKAVVGVSMGGMQALVWAVEHPDAMDQVVAVSGAARTSEADRARWSSGVADLGARPGWSRPLGALARLDVRDARLQLRVDPLDYRSQAEAVMRLDAGAGFGGSLERAGRQVRARLLVVVAERDEVVDPASSRELAGAAGGELLVLDGRCGHRASSCERPALVAAVARFLDGGLARGQ